MATTFLLWLLATTLVGVAYTAAYDALDERYDLDRFLYETDDEEENT